jgi:hypothetical protein
LLKVGQPTSTLDFKHPYLVYNGLANKLGGERMTTELKDFWLSSFVWLSAKAENWSWLFINWYYLIDITLKAV